MIQKKKKKKNIVEIDTNKLLKVPYDHLTSFQKEVTEVIRKVQQNHGLPVPPLVTLHKNGSYTVELGGELVIYAWVLNGSGKRIPCEVQYEKSSNTAKK